MNRQKFKLRKNCDAKERKDLKSTIREDAKRAIREGTVRDFLRKAGIPISEDVMPERSEQPS